MLAVLPYASLDPTLIQLGPFHGEKARLTYQGFEDVAILTPPLRFLQYDPVPSRILFDTGDQRAFAAKMVAVQDRIESLLPKTGYPLLHLANPRALALFTPSTTTLQKHDGTLVPLQLPTGTLVRCAIRLTSVYHHPSNTYRIQHSIVKLWIV